MLNFRLASAALVAAGLLVGMSQSAHAQTLLAPLGSATPPPPAGPFGGTLLASSSSAYTATNAGQTITGRLLSSVFQGGTAQNVSGTNFGGGLQLDFYYQLFLDSGSVGIVDQSTSISNFASTSLAVSQTTTIPVGSGFSAGGVTSAQVQRSGGVGSGLTFDFGAGIPIGSFSQTMVVRTTATNFSPTGGAAVLSATGVSANTTANVLAPLSSSGAPEPGSIALLGTGLVSMGGMVVRRRIAKK